jgi:hypothetical protein
MSSRTGWSSALSLFQDFSEDDEGLYFSESDRRRMKDLLERKVTMPLLITGTAILPDQTMEITSADPKFRNLLDHILDSPDQDEIAIVGLNPHNNNPLNIGVTAKVTSRNISWQTGKLGGGVSIKITGNRRFEIEDEPFLDDSGSFYLATLDIVDHREELMSQDELSKADELSQKLPSLLSERNKLVDLRGMKKEVRDVMKKIGPMPSCVGKRALWVGSLVNPNPLPELKLCSEIRPAMLACKNNYQRIYLAVLSLQSSIDFLASGEKAL